MAAGAANGQTFQSGDTINSAKNINITNVADQANLVTINGAEALNVTLASADGQINAFLYTGVEAINLVNSSANDLVVTNGQLATTYGVNNTTLAAGLSIGIRATDLTGTDDTLNIAVNTAGLTSVTPNGNQSRTVQIDATTAGIENIELSFEGANNIRITDIGATVETDYAGFVVTGAGTGTIDVQDLANVGVFDLSATTGANTLQFASGLLSGTEVIGGTGSNTMRVTQGAVGATTSNLLVSGVETLRLSTNSNADTRFNFSSPAPDFTTVRVDGDTDEGNTVTLSRVGTFNTLQYVGNTFTADKSSDQEFRTVQILNSFTGSDDTLAITVANGGTRLGSNTDYLIGNNGANVLNGVENLTVTISDIADSGVGDFVSGIASTTLATINVTTTGNVDLDDIDARGTAGAALRGTLEEVNFTDVVGASIFNTVDDTISDGGLIVFASEDGTVVSPVKPTFLKCCFLPVLGSP